MKNLLILLTLVLMTGVSNAQSLKILDEVGNDVSNSTYFINILPSASIVSTEFNVENVSNVNISVNSVRYEEHCTAGSGEFYCWTLCLELQTCGTSYERGMPFALDVEANSVSPYPLAIDFDPSVDSEEDGIEGVAEYTYVLFDDNNPSDSVYVNVVYNISENQGFGIICPNNILTNTDEGSCTAIVDNLYPLIFNENELALVIWTVEDINGIEQSPLCGINDVSGYSFINGISIITYLVMDMLGNTSSCTFQIEIYDNELPTYIVPDPCDTSIFPGSVFCVFPSLEDVPSLEYVTNIISETMMDNCLVDTMTSEILSTGDNWITYTFTGYDISGNANLETLTFLFGDNSVNVRELQKEPLRIYPNPSTGIIHCNYPYKVYTLQGQEVNGQLQSGVYLLVTEFGTERLVIQ